MKKVVPQEVIERKVLLIRGQKVMLDKDLAQLYGVTTGNLNKAVNRNLERFPNDFMFRLTKEEFKNLIFHFGTSNLVSQNVIPIFDAIRQLMAPPKKRYRRIGFRMEKNK